MSLLDIERKKLGHIVEAGKQPSSAFFSIEERLNNKEVILYGAGESSHWFIEIVMIKHGIKPSLVLDKRFREETTYEGIVATHPDHFFPSDIQLEESIVVICSGNFEITEEIVSMLIGKGFQNILPLHDIYEIHNPLSIELNDNGDYYLNQKDNILRAFDLLEDEGSRTVFLDFLKTHIQKKPVHIPRRPREEQYFPSDIKLSKGYSTFVSCGAYDGDTLRLLNQQVGKVEEVVCFEADRALFDRLAGFLRDSGSEVANKITALPCAIYSHESIANFTEATGLGSRIAEHGKLKVQTVALDNILPHLSPSMITMDIEGVELEALQGAEKIIRFHKPDLAICVYHAPCQIWDIPLYLNSLNLGYKFYLRNYTSFSLETVLYATV
jgi:FkbM family methyltransferase